MRHKWHVHVEDFDQKIRYAIRMMCIRLDIIVVESIQEVFFFCVVFLSWSWGKDDFLISMFGVFCKCVRCVINNYSSNANSIVCTMLRLHII